MTTQSKWDSNHLNVSSLVTSVSLNGEMSPSLIAGGAPSGRGGGYDGGSSRGGGRYERGPSRPDDNGFNRKDDHDDRSRGPTRERERDGRSSANGNGIPFIVLFIEDNESITENYGNDVRGGGYNDRRDERKGEEKEGTLII